jgi:hypothetical protein
MTVFLVVLVIMPCPLGPDLRKLGDTGAGGTCSQASRSDEERLQIDHRPPILLGRPHHSRRIRVLELDPVSRAAGAIGRFSFCFDTMPSSGPISSSLGLCSDRSPLARTARPAKSLALIEIGEAIWARIGTLARVLSGALRIAGT